MAIKSTVELEVKSNLKGFKGEIRQATIEAQEAVRTFGEFSPQAVEAKVFNPGTSDMTAFLILSKFAITIGRIINKPPNAREVI